jgi:decaprenylphospho-beta-D-erythro-pentofuranosid-2-ulose 2-reductase
MRRILLTGATSAIAQAAARPFAADGDSLVLAGRDRDRLETVAADLRARGAVQVEIIEIDFLDTERCPKIIEQARAQLDGLDVLLVAQGTLPDQAACEREVERTLREHALNTSSVIALLVPAANLFEAQGHGCLAVITSIAGVRGRRSNYVYGSAKAAVSAFLEGLRGRMAACGVSVVDIRPGFVDTPMTADIPKNPLFANATDVGQRVYQAVCRGEDVVYTPWYWRWIALVLQCIPRPVFKRLNF